MLDFLVTKTKACTVVGRGERSLLSGPGFESRLETEKGEGEILSAKNING